LTFHLNNPKKSKELEKFSELIGAKINRKAKKMIKIIEKIKGASPNSIEFKRLLQEPFRKVNEINQLNEIFS